MTRVHSALSVRRGLIYVCAAATAWGTGGAAAALLYDTSGLGPITVSFWRFVCGAALMAATSLLFPRPRAPRRRGLLVLFGSGMAISQAAYFASIAETGVAMATVITLGASPLVVAAGARVLLGERLGKGGAASMVAALAGLVLLIGPGTLSPLGAGYALLSAVTYGGVTLLSRAYPEDPHGTAQWSFIIGAVALLPLAAAQGLLPDRSFAATISLIGYLGAVPTALAYGLFFTGLSAIRATTASVAALIEPLGATAIGVLVFHERLAPTAVVGAAALLLSVTFLAWMGPRTG